MNFVETHFVYGAGEKWFGAARTFEEAVVAVGEATGASRHWRRKLRMSLPEVGEGGLRVWVVRHNRGAEYPVIAECQCSDPLSHTEVNGNR